MIGYGRNVAARTQHEQQSSATHNTDYLTRTLSLAAELRLRGVDVPSKFAGLFGQINALAELVEAPDHQERIAKHKKVLVKKYSTEDRPLLPRHFSIIPIPTKQGVVGRLIFTAPMPLQFGSWNELMKMTKVNTARHTGTVDNFTFDYRSAMDQTAHRTMATLAVSEFAAAASEQRLPDITEELDPDAEPGIYLPRTATYLTGHEVRNDYGQPLNDSRVAPVSFDDDVTSKLYLRSATGHWPRTGYRPGVNVPGLIVN